MPDVSFAGYRGGGVPLPEYKVVADVKRFGAKGDGKTDDTQAIKDALASVSKGAVFLPAGDYVITDPILMKSHVVLRGEGMGKTTLVIPKSLLDIKPKKLSRLKKLYYSFGGSFVTFNGKDMGGQVAEITGDCRRGSNRFVCTDVTKIKPGMMIRIIVRSHHDLGKELHAGLAEAGNDTLRPNRPFVDWAVNVVKVDEKKQEIEINRAFRLNLKASWKPVVHLFKPSLVEAGIENLTFQFAGRKKKRHLQEEGFNAIEFKGAVNCWASGIEVVDSDLGVKTDRVARNCTVRDMVLRAEKRTNKYTGHHGLWASGLAQDCLFEGFDFQTTFIHDISVEGFANGCVFRNGKGIRINLDHHRNAPYENLFTDLDAGNLDRLFGSSGRGDRGPHSGARTTLWNIRGKGKLRLATNQHHWPQPNYIGVGNQGVTGTPGEPSEILSSDRSTLPWIEPFTTVEPGDLYQSQLNRRLRTK